jgi:hypothetical protein
MNVTICAAKKEDWQTIQKLNNQVFLNDQKNDPDLNLNWHLVKGE